MTMCALGILVMTVINLIHFLVFEIVMSLTAMQNGEFFYGVPLLFASCNTSGVRADCENC